jgi:hypothetical protein
MLSLSRCFLLGLLLTASLVPLAQADSTYYYTGNTMTSSSSVDDVATSGPCPSPCALSITLDLSSALPADFSGDLSLTPVSFSFTDGTNTLDNSNTNGLLTGFYIYATNAEGIPTSWEVQATSSSTEYTEMLSCSKPACILSYPGGPPPATGWDQTSIYPAGTTNPGVTAATYYAGLTNDPGSWSLTTVAPPSVPEPGSLSLLGVGLLGLAGAVLRKRLA